MAKDKKYEKKTRNGIIFGYTWWFKDWGNDEVVFNLTLAERGLFRELIDLAMQSDNKIIFDEKNWERRFNSNEKELKTILKTLHEKGLITKKHGKLFIPSCEKRLKMHRTGKKGGNTKQENRVESRDMSRGESMDEATKQKQKQKVKESIKKKSRFTPPTQSEVLDYMNEKGFVDNSQKFVDFYESKGWMVGRNKMKDWKAAVRSNWNELKKEHESKSLRCLPGYNDKPLGY